MNADIPRTWRDKAVDHNYRPDLIDHSSEQVLDQPRAGCIHRSTPEGITVYMFWAEPGKFFSEQGHELPEAMAKLAGYDIEEFSRQRRKYEAMSAAQLAIEEEYKITGRRNVVETRGEYSLVEIANDRYNIEFADGTRLNPAPMGRDVANRVFETVAPKPIKK